MKLITMKPLSHKLGIGTLGLMLSLPLLHQLPAVAQITDLISNPNQVIAQADNEERPQINLDLAVARKKTTVTVEGEEVTWQELKDNAAVAPGDILRYTIEATNTGTEAAENLVVTQPISERMTYRLDSVASDSEAEVSYSIDQGETFVTEPTIEITQEDGTVVESPAPAEVYTHIRLTFPTVAPELGATATYEAQVQ
ncbi:MAG: hypothetical protein AAFQ80_22505 [Cyanobacteria bacterium J06621_8]